MSKEYLIIIVIAMLFIGGITLNGHSSQLQKVNPAIVYKMKKNKEETMALKIINAFRKNNVSLWLDLFPNDSEYHEIVHTMMEKGIDGLTEQKMTELEAQRKKEADSVYTYEFIKLVQLSKELELDWNRAVYEKFDFTSIYPEGFPRKYLNGSITLANSSNRFVIEGVEAIETETGYKLQSIKLINRSAR